MQIRHPSALSITESILIGAWSEWVIWVCRQATTCPKQNCVAMCMKLIDTFGSIIGKNKLCYAVCDTLFWKGRGFLFFVRSDKGSVVMWICLQNADHCEYLWPLTLWPVKVANTQFLFPSLNYMWSQIMTPGPGVALNLKLTASQNCHSSSTV